MENYINDILNINLFDLAFIILIIYFVIQCFLKGFSLSFMSFMKWIFALVVTIFLVPNAVSPNGPMLGP